MKMAGLDFLRGRIRVSRGTIRDYRALSHLHYVPGDPATVAGVWKVQYRVASDQWPVASRSSLTTDHCQLATRLVAVAVLSWPTPALRTRERTLRLGTERYGERLRWINENVRTISRVIVHPQFRSLGIASRLVRRVLCDCPTRYIEAIAAMGEVHPFFVRAGMTFVEPADETEMGYFIFDREKNF
jgi:GNAT superfamily N-acetyltransferase